MSVSDAYRAGFMSKFAEFDMGGIDAGKSTQWLAKAKPTPTPVATPTPIPTPKPTPTPKPVPAAVSDSAPRPHWYDKFIDRLLGVG